MAAAAAGGGGDDRRREGPWWLEWEKKQKEEGKEIPAQAEDELVPDPKSVENKNYHCPRGTTGDDVIDQELKKLVDAFNEIGVVRRRVVNALSLEYKKMIKSVPKSISEDAKRVMLVADKVENKFLEVKKLLRERGRPMPIQFPDHFLNQPQAIAYEKLGKGSEEAKKKKH